MTAIDQLFARLKSEGRKAFMPFITAGDPSVVFTCKVLQLLDRLGCSMAEVGIPYSDPIADGPVIQASYTRALNHKVKLAEIFQATTSVKETLSMPLVSMVSYAIIHRVGPEKYIDDAIQAGFSGAIVPDLLVEESTALSKRCKERDFNLIQLVTPTTPQERALRIAEQSSGFLYFVSVTGITGERSELPPDLVDRVSWLRERSALPICIGFGISRPEHVKLLAPVSDGVIVGSAIVRMMENAGTYSFLFKHRIATMKTYLRMTAVATLLCAPFLGCQPAANGTASTATTKSPAPSDNKDTTAENKETPDSQVEKKEENGNMAKDETKKTPGKEPDVITVQHCLIGFQGSVPGKPISRTKEEAKELAERLLKLLKDGDKFEEIINQFTDDSPPGIYKMTNNGVRQIPGAYPRGGMVPAFGDTGFPLQVGEYGLAEHDSMKSPYGWHIVKRIE